jgi:hypothetical protein
VARATIEINLLQNEIFKQYLIDTRAAKLAEVDAIEKVLGMERTKDLRRVVKDLKHHETLAGYVVKDA